MASKEAEEKCSNTKTGEATALKKQRSKSRRVSFAETTIHLFVRDEEIETPPEVPEGSRLHRSESDEIRELLGSDFDNDSGNSDDDVDDNDNGNGVESSFLRPFESPSSGSRFGSATSNDEDNFFGPVSADFIKPGRLSDSAASDENHDVTMDSTAFSMHFRSLAKSDPGGEIKTPTGVSLEFGERTSGQVSTTTSGGDLMVLTASRKQKSGSLLVDTINSSVNSDDMSVVGENPRRYDYGELPHDLEVFLAKDGKDVGAVSQISNAEYSNSINSFKVHSVSGLHKNGLDFVNLDNSGIYSHHVSDMEKPSGGSVSAKHVNIDIKGDHVHHVTLAETTHNTSNMDDDFVPVIVSDDQTKTSILLADVMPVDEDEEARRASLEASGKCFSSPLSSQSQLNHEQPIAGSVSSLLAKRRQIIGVSPYVKSNLSLPKKKFSDKGSKHIWSASAVEKGVSRHERFEAVPYVSASKAEGYASRLKPLRYLSSSLTRKKPLNSGSKDASPNYLAVPVTCLDTQFLDVAENKGKFQRVEKNGTYDMSSFEQSQHVSYTEIEDAELLSQSTTFGSRDKCRNFTGVSVSPALSKEKRLEPVSRDIDNKETVLSTGSVCSLLEMTYNDSNCRKETRIPGRTTFSPETSAERKVSASPLYQGSLSMSLNHQAKASFRQDRDVKQSKTDDLACRAAYFVTERKENAKRSTCVSEYSTTVSQEMQNVGSVLSNFDKASESCKLVIGCANADTGTVSTSAFQLNNMESDAGSAPTSEDILDEVSIQVSETFNEDSCLPDDGNACLFVGNSVLTPTFNQLTSNDRHLLKQSNTCSSDSSSSLKRKLFERVDDCNNETASFQPGPKLCKDIEGDTMLPHSTGGDATARNWDDVFTSFCGINKLLPSESIDKLNLAQIRMLNDVVGRLDKMRSYELVHRGMCSQKSFNPASFLQTKRLVGTKSLLYKTLYGKAKLQLMKLELDKLLDQVRQLDSRVEDSKILIKSCHNSCIHGQTDARKDCFSPDVPSKMSMLGAEIHLLRKELEMSDRGVQNLKKSFYAHSKILKEPTCTEPTVHLKNYVRKRFACRSVQSKFQLCQVGRIKDTVGELNLLFDYGGIMSQRFIVKSNSTYGLCISNSLNNEKICKMFHGVDARTAFSYTFSQSNLGHSGSLIIAQETQKTTSILHDVLDVVDEVESAMFELRNLTDSKFLQPSAGKLDLQLRFTDFSCGATVALSIDISCLSRGIYPSQVLPYEVQGRVATRHESFQSLVDKIRYDVRGVECGYMRILSLCRCVSRTIQANCM